MQQRRLEIAGIKLEGTDRKRFLLFLDEIELASMPKNLDAAGKVQWAVSKLRTVEQLEAIAAQRWQTKLAHATGGMGGGTPIHRRSSTSHFSALRARETYGR